MLSRRNERLCGKADRLRPVFFHVETLDCSQRSSGNTGKGEAAAEGAQTGKKREIDDALQRLGGNTDLYQELLCDFLANNKEAVNAIRSSLQNGDNDTAKRQAHTLKGVAGNIGALRVFEQAKLLDEAIENGEVTGDSVLLDTTEEALSEVIGALEQKLPQDEHSEEGHSGEQKALSSGEVSDVIRWMNELQGLLENNDLEAEDRAGEIAAVLKMTAHEDAIQSVLDALDEFDFDTALEETKKLTQRIQQNE